MDLCVVLFAVKGIDPQMRGNMYAALLHCIKSKVSNVVQEIFQLKEGDITLHDVLSYVPFGGALAESKNEELDEKMKAITDLMKELAGAMCSLPLI